MALLQAACAAIVALYLAARLARTERPAALLRRLGAIAAAAWIAENTCVRAYGFYAYAPTWTGFVDRVPLLIPLIWAVVIDSAARLADRLAGGRERLVAPVTSAIVLLDAALIEPIAVRAGLWSWTEPGLFRVPPVGMLGWAFFAGACVAGLGAREGRRAPAAELATVAAAPAATHGLLLAAWWGLLRWVSGEVPAAPAAALAWGALLPVAAWAFSRGPRLGVPARDLLLRLPGALFFFVLLAVHGRDDPVLVGWSLAFAPPYLALMARAGGRG